MAVPSPSLAVPSLSGSQRVAFRDDAAQIIFGGSPFTSKGLEGIDKPSVRVSNTNWSMWPGASAGNRQLNTRKITLTTDVKRPFGAYGTLPGALAALRNAISTEGVAEYPLWIQLPGFPLVACQGSVIQTAGFKWDAVSELGQMLTGGSIQFECTDPYLYSAPTRTTTISLPGPAGGFSFPLSFPLSFGGGSTPNTAMITNAGNVTCWPTLVITGPCLNPSISNGSIAGNPTISTSIQLYAGDQMLVDCRLGAIVVYRSGSSIGAPSQFVLQPGSEFFGLPRGSSSIAFNSADTSSVAGSLQVLSADAYNALI